MIYAYPWGSLRTPKRLSYSAGLGLKVSSVCSACGALQLSIVALESCLIWILKSLQLRQDGLTTLQRSLQRWFNFGGSMMLMVFIAYMTGLTIMALLLRLMIVLTRRVSLVWQRLTMLSIRN